MEGYLYSGIIFVLICVLLITLAYVYYYYENLSEGLEVSSKAMKLYSVSVDAGRIFEYGVNNVVQDAVFDSVAIVFTAYGYDPCNYSYVACEVDNGSLLNSTNVPNNVTLSDGFVATCYKYFFDNNVSLGGKIVCIGNPIISGIARVYGTDKIIIGEWYNITHNETARRKFFLSNFSVTCSNITIKYFFLNDTIYRGSLVFHPDFYTLVSKGFDIHSPGEYGGITGCGFGKIVNNSSNNYSSPANCEVEPFDNGSTEFAIYLPKEFKKGVCKALTYDDYTLFEIILKVYLEKAISEMVDKYGIGVSGSILEVNVTGPPVNCCAVGDEIPLNLSIYIKYSVSLGGLSKEAGIKTYRNVFVKFREKEIGTVARRVTQVWEYNNSTNSTYRGANCTVYCSENKSMIKDTNESVSYAEIYVYNIPRFGLPPEEGWSSIYPFHLITWYNEHTHECGRCDDIIQLLDSGVYDCETVCTDSPYAGDITCDLTSADETVDDQIVTTYHLNITVKNNVCVNINETCGEVRYGW